MTFNCTAITALTCLTRLALRSPSFTRFDLGLPASVRVLELSYCASPLLAVAELPPGARLDVLCIAARECALGLDMGGLWDSVARLDVEAEQLLLGVPVADEHLVWTFERPFREGHFVPPHIWADEEADNASRRAAEATASSLMRCLAAPGRRLQDLKITGPCASSVKFQPLSARCPGAESLRWLWSVIYLQGLAFLVGLSSAEMRRRVLDLRALR